MSVPIIAFFFITDQFLIGTILFLFSAFSDAVDGAIARTKNKISAWGMLNDPLADKLLIGTVSIIVVSKYLSPYLALTIIVLEIFLVSFAYFRYKGKVVPAKTMGKIKMILQCVGIIFLLFYILFNIPILFTLANITLYGAVVFALLSLFVFRSI
jgi:CDP-diacylglycerol--glycerol-3-phosphate 3-phosphatidyltransferase